MRLIRNLAVVFLVGIVTIVGNRPVIAEQFSCQGGEDLPYCDTGNLGTQCINQNPPGPALCDADLGDTCSAYCTNVYGSEWDSGLSYCDWSNEYMSGILWCVDDYSIHCECVPVPGVR